MRTLTFVTTGLALIALVGALLVCGPVSIPASEVATALMGGETSEYSWGVIVLESRLPLALTALLAGVALPVAGLLLQTNFRNPLAGPSILGVSSGASLGVGIVMLAGVGTLMSGVGQNLAVVGGALLGAAAVLAVLVLFSGFVKGVLALLIVGIMTGYLAGSAVSLLNFFAPSDAVRNFMVWGLGSYSGVQLSQLPLFAGLCIVPSAGTILLSKPLNATLLGERYLASMGYNPMRLRTIGLSLSGLLTAIVTAYCGPIGFIGLVVPHVARLLFGTSDHRVLLPAAMLTGGVVSCGCALISVLPAWKGIIPINAITPIVGVPVIIYLSVRPRTLR